MRLPIVAGRSEFALPLSEAPLLARIRSATVLGVEALAVDVEIDIANGLPSFTTVGLPLGAVKEGRERVAAALGNSGYQLPLRRITVNLAPADVQKRGSAFDLPVAIGILAASGQLPPGRLSRTLFSGSSVLKEISARFAAHCPSRWRRAALDAMS